MGWLVATHNGEEVETCEKCGKTEPEVTFEHDGPAGWCDECGGDARAMSRAYSRMDEMKAAGTW